MDAPRGSYDERARGCIFYRVLFTSCARQRDYFLLMWRAFAFILCAVKRGVVNMREYSRADVRYREKSALYRYE